MTPESRFRDTPLVNEHQHQGLGDLHQPAFRPAGRVQLVLDVGNVVIAIDDYKAPGRLTSS
jgi:hypothetical protein